MMVSPDAEAMARPEDKDQNEIFKTLLRELYKKLPDDKYYALHAAHDAALTAATMRGRLTGLKEAEEYHWEHYRKWRDENGSRAAAGQQMLDTAGRQYEHREAAEYFRAHASHKPE